MAEFFEVDQDQRRVFLPGFEPGTFRVLGERDDHYTTETAEKLSTRLRVDATLIFNYEPSKRRITLGFLRLLEILHRIQSQLQRHRLW